MAKADWFSGNMTWLGKDLDRSYSPPASAELCWLIHGGESFCSEISCQKMKPGSNHANGKASSTFNRLNVLPPRFHTHPTSSHMSWLAELGRNSPKPSGNRSQKLWFVTHLLMGRHLISYSQRVSVQQGVKHPRRVGVLREIPVCRPRDAGKPAGDWQGCCMLQSTAPVLFKGRAAARLQDLGTCMMEMWSSIRHVQSL